MWKLVSGISLSLCTLAMADEVPPKPSVSVKCCGRLRHGLMAIGGETTGTSVTFKRITWELQLHNDVDRAFAEKHNKEPVVVTGSLRKICGIEVRDRWIVDVKSVSICNAANDKAGAQLSIQGTLRVKESRAGASVGMAIDADGHNWPVEFSPDAKLQTVAQEFLGQRVLLTGQLKQFPDEKSRAPVIRVKTLQQAASIPDQDPGD